MLGGKEVINRVVERVSACVPALVATDDDRILQAVRKAGGNAVMTRADHTCGTDRVREAADSLPRDIDVIINVQGDEPFIHPDQIKALTDLFVRCPDTDIATLVRPLPPDTPYERLADTSLVKAVVGDGGLALYFSRQPIPFLRGVPTEQWTSRHKYYAHIGIYAYRTEALRRITSLPPSSLETAESLEQLRWLQAGMRIRVAESDHMTVGIDTPADLAEAESILASM